MEWNLDEAIRYYKSQGAPRDQAALIGLLREIQTEFHGGIPMFVLPEISAAYEIGEAFLKAIIHRIPSLRIENTHRLEICNGPNCGKHTQIAALAENYLRTHPGSFEIRYVPCMRMCKYGPNIKWDGKIHHCTDIASLQQLLENS